MIKSQKDILDELMSMHKDGLPLGSAQGLSVLDSKLKLVGGGCTDIIGYPFHGKSLLLKEWVVNLATNANWKWLAHLPDDGDDIHVLADLVHILSGKTFNKKYDNAITEREVQTYTTALLSAIDFVSANEAVTPQDLFKLTESGNYNGLAIDSWNRLGHTGSIKDPDYVGRTLSERNRVMMRSGAHCLMTMHPKAPTFNEIKDGKVTPPSVYTMYGGSEVNNLGKNIVIIYKENRMNYLEPYLVSISKVKPKQCGEVGELELNHDWGLMRFYDTFSVSGRRDYAKGAIEEPKESNDPF